MRNLLKVVIGLTVLTVHKRIFVMWVWGIPVTMSST